MKKKATVLIASIMAFCGINTAHADEGMWTIYNLPNAVYEMMQREGFSILRPALQRRERLEECCGQLLWLLLRRSRFSRRFGIYQPPLRFRGYQKPLYRRTRLHAQRFLC